MPVHADMSTMDMVNLIYIDTDPKLVDFAPSDRVRLIEMGLARECGDRLAYTTLGARVAGRLGVARLRDKEETKREPAEVITLYPPQSPTIRPRRARTPG